jgi:transglutaminase-like putative cysteine protease
VSTRARPVVGVGNRAGDAQTAAEMAVVALSLATVFGFCRLFVGWSWFPTFALAAVASHLLAIFCRRRGLGLVLSSIASLAGLALFTSLAFYRDSSAFGLPTRATWHAMTDDLASGWHDFGTAIALVEPRTGFMVAAVFAVWLSAFLADGFGFRAGAGPEMLVAPGILFVFCSALAGERFRLLSAALWLGCAALAFVLHRSMLQEDGSGWLTTHRRGTISAAARVGSSLGLGAIAIALVVAPLLPGAGDNALIDTRNPRSGSRQTISPLVDIQGRIANQSDTELFTVKAPTPSYWRLTALDLFDGRIWSSARTYSDASGTLGGGLSNGHTTPLQQDYTIKGLSSIWFPAAFAPSRISIGEDVRYDAATASIVTKSGDTAEGQQYTVESQIPTLTPDALQAANTPAPGDVTSHYTELPVDFPNNLTQLAQQITANGSTVYEKSLLLQNWFRRNFTYDLEVQRGHGINAIEAFLNQRKGYCEQFAGTFAAFARALRLPSRVAVGFTQGTAGPDGFYHVEGKHAHAWPEVYFQGIGWVPFEPTPTRGAPGDEVFTGVPQQQVGEAPQSTSTTTVAGATTGSAVSIAPLTPDGDIGLADVPVPDFGLSGSGRAASDSGRPWIVTAGIVLLILLVLAGLWILVVPRLISGRWGRRRRAARSEADRVLVSWHETEAALARSGVAPRLSETPAEFAARAARTMRIDDVGLERLADHVTVAAYSGTAVEPELVNDADGIRDTVTRALRDRADLRTRLHWRMDPRPLVQPLPGDHERRRHLELVDR